MYFSCLLNIPILSRSVRRCSRLGQKWPPSALPKKSPSLDPISFLVCRLCRHKGTIDLYILLISVCDDHHGHKIYSVMYVFVFFNFWLFSAAAPSDHHSLICCDTNHAALKMKSKRKTVVSVLYLCARLVIHNIVSTIVT
jgi:hypothetical protein